MYECSCDVTEARENHVALEQNVVDINTANVIGKLERKSAKAAVVSCQLDYFKQREKSHVMRLGIRNST